MSAFDEWIKNYEQALDVFRDNTQKAIDAMNEAFDTEVEAIQLEVEIKTDSAEDRLKHLDFLIEQANKDSLEAAKSIKLMGDELGQALRKQEAYVKGIDDILTHNGIGAGVLNDFLD